MGNSKTVSIGVVPPPKPNVGKDLISGFLVFLIALPLCLGIAMASGFPPVAGITSAAVGGILVSFLGSARLTIKGPAAGMIVIVAGAVYELGAGDPIAGYRQALAVGVVAAVIQIVLALVRAASVGAAMPTSVVHGMLAAIGVIIFSKQSHVLLGATPEGKEPLHLLLELPHSIWNANPEIAGIGVSALVLLFGLPLLLEKLGRFEKLPAQLVVLLVAVPLGLWFQLDSGHYYSVFQHDYYIGPEYLVSLPGSIVSAVALPDFSNITSAISIKYILMFALVGSIESTLSVLAVDTLDPAKRPSSLNGDLFSVGVGNLISSCIGGLPMISEIVRSKANIDAGATSKYANFFHGVLLLASVALIPHILHLIPLTALAAMLVFVGMRLASPKEFQHMAHLGRDQLAVFLTTMVITLATDLLIGVAAGLVLSFLLNLVRGATPGSLLRADVTGDKSDSTVVVVVRGSAGFRSLMKVRELTGELPVSVTKVRVDLSEANVVSSTFLERLDGIAEEWENAKLELVGLERLRSASAHPHANRWRSRQAA
jgi:MFS superfamily sulfate permease-like transporter